MLNASVLVSNALAARDHADRAQGLLYTSHVAPPLKRRASMLEEAAARMELEAKAALLRRWRGQTPTVMWQPLAVRTAEVTYVEPRHVLRRLRFVPDHSFAMVFGLSQPAKPAVDWAALSHFRSRADAAPGTTLSRPDR
jgi:hypothetical protein